MMVLPNRLAIALFPLMTLLCTSLLHAEADVELTRHMSFEIGGSRAGGYTLEARTVVATTFRSQRSIRSRGMRYAEPFYAPFLGFEVYFRNGYLDARQIELELDHDQDIFLSGHILRSVTLPPDLKPGDSMAVSYAQRYSSLAYLPVVTIPNVNRVREYRIEIEHPKGVTIDFDFFFPCDSIAYSIERPESTETVLLVRNLEKRPDLPGFPYNEMQAAVHMRASDAAGTINAASTQEFATWYGSLFDHATPVPSHYDTLLAVPIAAAPTAYEKLRVIHDYVRRSIRYIADERGENAIIPRMPGRVLEQGYGDCKDRAFLVAAIARRHGITVYPVLLSTTPVPIFKGTHVWQFNHAICAYGDGPSRMYFDPTARHCAFGTLPGSDVGAQALVLSPAGAEKVRIPLPVVAPSTIEITGSLEDAARCRFRATITDELLHGIRWILDGKDQSQAPNRLARLLAGNLQKISFDSIRVVSDADSAIVLEGSADLARFVVAGSAGRRYLPRLPFVTGNADLLERQQDSFAIYPGASNELVLSLSLAAPGMTLLPDSTSLAGGGGSFSARASSTGNGMMRAEYRIAQREPYLSGTTRDSFIEYYRALLKSRSAVFTLNTTGQ